MPIRKYTHDDETTDRRFEIMELLQGTATNDADVELSALVAVTAMYFLSSMDIPLSQSRVSRLCDRMAQLFDDFSEQYANAHPETT